MARKYGSIIKRTEPFTIDALKPDRPGWRPGELCFDDLGSLRLLGSSHAEALIRRQIAERSS